MPRSLLRSLAALLLSAAPALCATIELPQAASIKPLGEAAPSAPAAALSDVSAAQPGALPASALPSLEAGAAGVAEAAAAPTADAALAGTQAALDGLFDNARAQRPLETLEDLNVGQYNLENLFEQVGKHEPDPDRPGHLKRVSDAKPKPDWAMKEQGRIILESKLDVVVVEEVEDVAALEDFNKRFLDGQYRVFLIEGNDERGIDIAFLVKKDLPFQVEQRTHKDETWEDPALGGKRRKLFSRDLTSLILRAPGKTEPLFVLFGTHYKSKRDRDGDPQSNILRAAQVERTVEIMARYRKEFGDVPMMLGGDFNGVVPEEDAFKPLFAAAGLTDGFDASPNPPRERDRITHTFHPRGDAAHMSQMDALLVSKDLRGAVKDAAVYRYRDADGTVRPLPTTYEEREKNPSDHFPVIVKLSFQPIFKRRFPSWKPAPKPKLEPAQAAAILASSAAAWLSRSGPGFDSAVAQWREWAADPAKWLETHHKRGWIDNYTLRNVPELVARLGRLEAAEKSFAVQAAGWQSRAPPDAAAVRPLLAAWQKLKAAGEALHFFGDGRDPDPAKRALIADGDQGRRHQPDAYGELISAGAAYDTEAADALSR